MPNVTRGAKMTGLMKYLVGPGKANEHTDPHLVAGDPAIMAWHDDATLSMEAARDVARQVDQPRRVFGTKVMVPKRAKGDDGSWGTGGLRDGNVWHCSLALKAEEGEITDDKWSDIANDFMREMGFAEDGLSPARWVAVRHGLSANGNDHIHIAATCVREDGTKVALWDDWKKSQRAAHALEMKYGLAVTEGRASGIATRGYSRAERHKAAGKGGEPARLTLARNVRACASAAVDEADFVRRVRAEGMLIRPRFAAGTEDVVTGYSAALAPRTAQGKRDFAARSVWFGGGQLSKDLTLPRLRNEWPDSPSHSLAAVAEWRRAKRERPAMRTPVSPTVSPELLAQAEQDLGRWTSYLKSIPVEDRAEWARAAGQTAGVFAAWSARTETTPGPLAHAADALARCAGISAHRFTPKRAGRVKAGGAALLLMTASSHTKSVVVYTVLMRQLLAGVTAIADASAAAGDAQRALSLALVCREQTAFAQSIPEIAVDVTADRESDFPIAPDVAQSDGLRPAGSALPHALEPVKRARGAKGTSLEESRLPG
ncbi:relaxase/mobilization nuclease domain-containing protein [Nocardia sp. 348MFTsu5.1]|uniref:relaxase/mobilization nuclease domain-containing protein n=1 Tax=Nocardia sp. 348MFTsu5.1 TaxID=1172185 RepID=UPI000370EF9C|nr:relaxase/mobilization nuclease domain-containing protein [Nocardia sp. 348MFTsu5.1]